MCQSMVDIQSPTAEIRRGKKKKEEEERNRMKKYIWSALLHRATIKKKQDKNIMSASATQGSHNNTRTKQEGQHSLTRQRAANFRLLAKQ